MVATVLVVVADADNFLLSRAGADRSVPSIIPWQQIAARLHSGCSQKTPVKFGCLPSSVLPRPLSKPMHKIRLSLSMM